MKNILYYLLSIATIIILIFFIKKQFSNPQNNDAKYTSLNKDFVVKAEIEILNGCGKSGIANLYSNYIRKNNFDVIEIKNADNFNYENTLILIHNSFKENEAIELANLLKINKNNIKFNNDNIWDLSIIIGKDYNELKSFEEIQKHYSLF